MTRTRHPVQENIKSRHAGLEARDGNVYLDQNAGYKTKDSGDIRSPVLVNLVDAPAPSWLLTTTDAVCTTYRSRDGTYTVQVDKIGPALPSRPRTLWLAPALQAITFTRSDP